MNIVKGIWKCCKSVFKLTLGVALLIGMPMILLLHMALTTKTQVGGKE